LLEVDGGRSGSVGAERSWVFLSNRGSAVSPTTGGGERVRSVTRVQPGGALVGTSEMNRRRLSKDRWGLLNKRAKWANKVTTGRPRPRRHVRSMQGGASQPTHLATGSDLDCCECRPRFPKGVREEARKVGDWRAIYANASCLEKVFGGGKWSEFTG